MPLFTIFAFVIFGIDSSKRKQFYKTTGDGFVFGRYQVASTGRAADTQDISFDGDLV